MGRCQSCNRTPSKPSFWFSSLPASQSVQGATAGDESSSDDDSDSDEEVDEMDPPVSQDLLEDLLIMGFPENHAIKGLIHTENTSCNNVQETKKVNPVLKR